MTAKRIRYEEDSVAGHRCNNLLCTLDMGHSGPHHFDPTRPRATAQQLDELAAVLDRVVEVVTSTHESPERRAVTELDRARERSRPMTPVDALIGATVWGRATRDVKAGEYVEFILGGPR